jgi:hypothetical protein
MPQSLVLEQAWRTLRPTLELGYELALVFVFSENRLLKEALYRRADDLLRSSARVLQRPILSHASDSVQDALSAVFDAGAARNHHAMPLWVDFDGDPSDPLWESARIEFLLRLNERRSSLMREQKRVILLCFPAAMTKQVAEAAPDLWTIRQPSIRLEAEPRDTAGLAKIDVRTTPQVDALKVDPSQWPLALRRWKAGPTGDFKHLGVWDGLQAADSAFELGLLELAESIVQQASQIARASYDEDPSPERLRDVSVSLNKIGDIARAQGRLELAQK